MDQVLCDFQPIGFFVSSIVLNLPPVTNVFIHPTAIVDQGAKIGLNSKVWHFCHIMPRARIGSGCILGQNVFIADDVVIGNHVKIQNNVSVYKGVVLDDDVFVGPSAVFTNVINPRAFVERKEEFLPTRVGKGASIGANATIICGTKLGSYCMVGAAAVVTKDVPAYAQVMGNPAVISGWRSEVGGKLDFTKGRARCPISDQLYEKVDMTVRKIK